MVCTGCALLCDDIELTVSEDGSIQTFNVCMKGFSMLKGSLVQDRKATHAIKGTESTHLDCLAEAAGILRKARYPRIVGLENLTRDAQIVGIKLANMLGATISDLSSFSLASLVKAIFEGSLPSCTLEEAKRWADTVIYWGAYPHKTHPRHLARYYYSVTEEMQGRGELQRTLASVDVQLNETVSVSNSVFLLKSGEDPEFLGAILNHLLKGINVDSRVRDFVKLVSESRFCVIYAGTELVRALDGRLELFIQVIHELGRYTSLKVIPMVSHSNARGLYELLYAEESSHPIIQIGQENSDCCLCFGGNSATEFPENVTGELRQVPKIIVGPLSASVAGKSDISIRIGQPGLECNGDMTRMDGVKVSLRPELALGEITDKFILEGLLSFI